MSTAAVPTRTLRVLMIGFNLPWQGGGTFYRMLGFATELARRGHQVTMLMTSRDRRWRMESEEVDGVRLVQAPAWIRGKLRAGWDPWDLVRRCLWSWPRRFDVVHGFECRPVVIYPALLARRHGRSRLVLDWCDWMGAGGLVEQRRTLVGLQRTVETYFEERFRHRADATTVINEPLRARVEAIGVDPETVYKLPNGADIEAVQVLDRDDARQALDLPMDVPIIGHLGQTGPGDARLMARAFERVKRACPSCRLLIIGNYKRDITRTMADDPLVIDTGYVRGETLNRTLAACDLLWLPLEDTLANRGRWPMKISDYTASGRPVVSTQVGDWVDLFEGDRPIGVLASPDDAGLAEATISLLDDPETRATLGRNARQIAVERFAWPRVTDLLEAIYLGHASDAAPAAPPAPMSPRRPKTGS